DQDLLSLFRFEIDGKRALVSVEREEGDVDLVASRAARRDMALPFAVDRRALDHIGAETAQPLCREGPGNGDGEVEHTDLAQDTHCENAFQCMTQPPSTLMVWPVMKPDSSEARNISALAMSRAWPRRLTA